MERGGYDIGEGLDVQFDKFSDECDMVICQRKEEGRRKDPRTVEGARGWKVMDFENGIVVSVGEKPEERKEQPEERKEQPQELRRKRK